MSRPRHDRSPAAIQPEDRSPAAIQPEDRFPAAIRLDVDRDRAAARPWQRHRERGSIAPAIPIVALALLLLGGLVIDASRQLNARGEAVAFAEEAARAGAQAVELSPEGEVRLNPGDVPGLVADYCSAVRGRIAGITVCELVRIEQSQDGTPRPLVVVTRVEMDVPASLLGMVGVNTLHATGHGRAEPRGGEVTAPPPSFTTPP